jgi:hypothetical protein
MKNLIAILDFLFKQITVKYLKNKKNYKNWTDVNLKKKANYINSYKKSFRARFFIFQEFCSTTDYIKLMNIVK